MSEYSLTYTRPVSTPGGRARPLPAEDRRLLLVQAAIDLIRRTGAAPTTKAVADEAGVAEGTVFRAFPTKEALLEAVVGAVACPASAARALAAIDSTLPLRDRLIAGTAASQERFTSIVEVLAPLGLSGPPIHHDHPGCRAPEAGGQRPSGLARLVEPEADRLRVPVEDVVHALRLLAFAGRHHHMPGARLRTPEEIVDLVLHGVLTPQPSEASC